MDEPLPKPPNEHRHWIIPLSLAAHVILIAIFLAPWPQLNLDSGEPQAISVEIIAQEEEEQAPEEQKKAQEAEEKQDEAQEAPAEPEASSQEVEEEQGEPAPSLNSLPAIPIRPDAEQNSAQDEPDVPDGAAQNRATEAAENPSSQADASLSENADEAAADARTVGDEGEPSEGDLPATSEEGELPSQATAPLPLERPEPPLQALQEVQPLSNEALEQGGLRAILGDLPPHRRLMQICTIEALNQVRVADSAYARVGGMVPYADGGGEISGGRLRATGGAFNVGSRWTEIDFDCEVDLENYRVIRFSKRIGNVLSADEVRRRGYPAQ